MWSVPAANYNSSSSNSDVSVAHALSVHYTEPLGGRSCADAEKVSFIAASLLDSPTQPS